MDEEINTDFKTPSIYQSRKEQITDKAVSHDSEREIIRNLDGWTLKNKFNKNMREKSLKSGSTKEFDSDRFVESSPIKKRRKPAKKLSDFNPNDGEIIPEIQDIGILASFDYKLVLHISSLFTFKKC